MRILKPLIASAVLAASTLGFVATSAPAQACGYCGGGIKLNGLSLNGMRFNGIRLNGVRLNGVTWNGLQWNGLQLNGAELAGMLGSRTAEAPTQAGQVVAVTLPQ